MHYLIYEIRHNKTGKTYIGKHQTSDINDDYMGSGKLIRRALQKYGSDAFTKTILFDFSTVDEMNAKERELVTEEFCQRTDTYNICEGGKGGWSYVNRTERNNSNAHGIAIHSELRAMGHRAFLSRMQSEDFRRSRNARISASLCQHFAEHEHQWKGRRHTNESKNKIGKANADKVRGENNGRFGTMWITNEIDSKVIHKTDAIPDGWRKGRVIKSFD